MIRNRAGLEKFHGQGAAFALGALEAAIKSVEPGALVRQAVRFDGKSVSFRDIYGNRATIGGFKDAYVVGAGKAAAAMAGALCDVLKKRVAGGAINVPRGTDVSLDRIYVTYASHPVPDPQGVKGTERIAAVLESVGQDDLALVVISGGGSALMPMPAKGVTLADKQKVTKELLASGASIHEINAVRKHLSQVKGGQLARRAKCRIVSLVMSDVVGDDLSVIASGPTFPDQSTFQDALKIIDKYGIKNPKVRAHIMKGVRGKVEETPKPGDPAFRKVRNILIGNNQVACKSAAGYLAGRGFAVENLGSEFGGEARKFGVFMARLASNRADAPFALVAGGETTVRLAGRVGTGGRNQEAALACAVALKRKGAALVFAGTDGIDGNSDAAGAIASWQSHAIARKMGMQGYLRRHDSYTALKKMNSLVFTGYTGTNVNDIAIAVSS
jgi:glycerate-2-kinase